MFPEGKILDTAQRESEMTLNELLPGIHQLNPTDKQKLFDLLDVDGKKVVSGSWDSD